MGVRFSAYLMLQVQTFWKHYHFTARCYAESCIATASCLFVRPCSIPLWRWGIL